jgi:hypothetical protein
MKIYLGAKDESAKLFIAPWIVLKSPVPSFETMILLILAMLAMLLKTVSIKATNRKAGLYLNIPSSIQD